MSQAELGRWGERMAREYLQASGLVVLDTNWRCALGEIDIVALDGATLVICEVKTRRGTGYGWPLEGVTGAKASRLRALGSQWRSAHQHAGLTMRFDAIGILAPTTGPIQIEHVRGTS